MNHTTLHSPPHGRPGGRFDQSSVASDLGQQAKEKEGECGGHGSRGPRCAHHIASRLKPKLADLRSRKRLFSVRISCSRSVRALRNQIIICFMPTEDELGDNQCAN